MSSRQDEWALVAHIDGDIDVQGNKSGKTDMVVETFNTKLTHRPLE